MNCFTANASGRRLPLHFITLQELHFVSPPFVPFRSLSAPALATHASMLPIVSTLAFPCPISGMPCEVFAPEKQKKPQKPHRPLMVQVKIKDHSRMAFVLAAGSFHSFNRSPLRSYLTTQLTNSFRSSHQLQHRTCKWFVTYTLQFPPSKFHSASGCFSLLQTLQTLQLLQTNVTSVVCVKKQPTIASFHFANPIVSFRLLTTHTFPHPQFNHFRLFLPAKCLPHENHGR